MKTRLLVPELMDDLALDSSEHFQALRGLQRINRWTQNASLAWRPLKDLARQLGKSSLRVLDIATGGADIPIQLWQRAQRVGLELQMDATDVSSQALEFAAGNCKRAGAPLILHELDVLKHSINERYDVVMCSQFLHHLTGEQAELVLGKMKTAATHRVLAVDLVRSKVNWLQVWFATRMLSRSKIVHFDGPQSIRASFTIEEMKAIAGRVGFPKVSIQPNWPCRFVLIGEAN
jgi:2-polyprenyl-3-methyl-5-hydroxy-6-metoxy-1,4-benzoquinol methylase